MTPLRSSFLYAFATPLMLISWLKNSNCCRYSVACAVVNPLLMRSIMPLQICGSVSSPGSYASRAARCPTGFPEKP